MELFLQLTLTTVAFCQLFVYIQAKDKNIVREFSDEFSWMDNDIPQFNSLAIDKNTGRVYVGAVNKLYQLSPDLDLTISAITGPKEDSPLCSVLPECPSSVEKKLTNNVNKALVIDYAESRIIECGSLYQVCTKHSIVLGLFYATAMYYILIGI